MSYTCCTYFSKEIVYDYRNKCMSNLHMHMKVLMICFQIYMQMEIRAVDLIRHLYIFPSYIGGAAFGFIIIYKLKAHIHTVCKKLFMHIFSIFFFLAFHHSFFSLSNQSLGITNLVKAKLLQRVSKSEANWNTSWYQ